MPERSISDFWDARAQEEALYFVDSRRAYGDGDVASLWRTGETDLARLLELAGERIPPDAVVLELGCGVGRMTRAIAASARQVIAVDVSAAMLARGRELCADVAHVRWVHGDGTSLDGIPDGTVDVVLSYATLQHVPAPQTILGYVQEAGRVLTPGGWAALQLSTDPRAHGDGGAMRGRPAGRRIGRRDRSRPAALREAEWVGSATDTNALHVAAVAGGLDLEQIIGSGSRFTIVLARRPAAG